MKISITDSKILFIFSLLQVAALSTPVANKTKGSFASSLDHHNLVKRSTCPQDEHAGNNGLCCQMCTEGQQLKEDCTTEHGNPTCVQCPLGTYTSYPNYLTECEFCRVCDKENGLVEELPCSITSNRKCRCVKGFYCDAKTDCFHCKPCQKCVNSEIEKECTQTNNTVCKPRAESDNNWWIFLIVLPIVAVAVILVIGSFYCWITKKLCFGKKYKLEVDENRTHTIEVDPLLPDIDLQPHLYFIANTVGFSETRKFLLTNGFSKGEVENIVGNNPNSVRDQAFELWAEWYQRHGIPNAYSTLIKKLQEMKLNQNADAILREVSNCSK
ncbi:tumor necrosis factor receptor superfamily member 6-like isoform X2 [Huso huso]|uniref:Tumor necrosis factor receptor superfamily member 6 n=1 Tax=Huso huso TaxID=61971 RepID=A0ABR0ZRW1_HUSHU